MSDSSPSFQPPAPSLSEAEQDSLFLMLRRKEKNWLEWGKACYLLQRVGHSTQAIFEATGFEPVQQNQVIVAAQVYESLVQGQAEAGVQAHFQQRGSDVLYELRLLNQEQRVKAASLALQQRLELDDAKELAKAYQEFARLRQKPEGFGDDPGDALAYQFWRLARARVDLQDRSRLIAKGLRFAASTPARKKLEELLTDFTVVVSRPAPTMPLYRLETETDLPRVVPLLGTLPLAVQTVTEAGTVQPIEHPFPVVSTAAGGTWLPLPGWPSIVAAQDPIAVETRSETLPNPPAGRSQPVVVVLDRASREWDGESYYGVDRSGQLALDWFEEAPTEPIVGRVVVVLRAPRIFDEDAITVPWQLDE